MSWFVYMVEDQRGYLYTGITTDLSRRVREHNGGKKGSKALRGHRPVKLVWEFEVADRSQASKLEAHIKGRSAKVKRQMVEIKQELDSNDK